MRQEQVTLQTQDGPCKVWVLTPEGGGIALTAAAYYLDRIAAALNAAGVKHKSELYKDKRHGWMKPDMPVYDAEAAERGWRELFALYARTLR